jgi:Holliday junction DNA helicase RuvA
MIGYLTGTLIHKGDKYVLIDVSGVGYKVFVSTETINSVVEDRTVSMWTHLVVREDVLDLYGFLSEQELDFFKLLIGVSGIGPKGALGIMNIASVQTLASAISAGDLSYLTKVSGVGKKSAEKIVLELRDKVGLIFGVGEYSQFDREDMDVIEALKSLGYRERESREALKQLPLTLKGTSQKISEALKLLGTK